MTPDELGRFGRTLDRIDGKVDVLGERTAKMEQRLDDLVSPGDGASCRLHEDQIGKAEQALNKVTRQQDKQNLIAVVLSAVTAAILMAGKWLIGVNSGSN